MAVFGSEGNGRRAKDYAEDFGTFRKPDAVIAGSDEVAAGMVMEALKNGVKIPQDIAIMGVDDQPLASYLQIPLTTIWQPVQDEGRCAAKEMVRQLKVNQKE